MRWSDGQTDFTVLDLMFSDNFEYLILNSDIYFVSGRYGCSSVVATDVVVDVAAAMCPVFVACYHFHLPRSSYKHGASLKAPYPLRISQLDSFYFRMRENGLGFFFFFVYGVQVAERLSCSFRNGRPSTGNFFLLCDSYTRSCVVNSTKGTVQTVQLNFCNLATSDLETLRIIIRVGKKKKREKKRTQLLSIQCSIITCALSSSLGNLLREMIKVCVGRRNR